MTIQAIKEKEQEAVKAFYDYEGLSFIDDSLEGSFNIKAGVLDALAGFVSSDKHRPNLQRIQVEPMKNGSGYYILASNGHIAARLSVITPAPVDFQPFTYAPASLLSYAKLQASQSGTTYKKAIINLMHAIKPAQARYGDLLPPAIHQLFELENDAPLTEQPSRITLCYNAYYLTKLQKLKAAFLDEKEKQTGIKLQHSLNDGPAYAVEENPESNSKLEMLIMPRKC